MAKFHINDNGDAKQCSAEEGNCPFGADAPHFDTKKEAQQHYEQTFKNSFEKPKPVKKTTVYRVGTLSAPETYFDDLNNILDAVDELKPDGRQGRKGGIFASPDIKSHSRWVLGSQWNKHEGSLDSHEITVDANSVYVYDVEQYEEVSAFERMYGKDSEKFKQSVEKFWKDGMTLADWQEWAKENKPDPGDWEIIMPAEAIMNSKKLNNRKIIENAPENHTYELNHLLEPNRARKGLIWRKNDLTDEEKVLIQEKVSENKDLNENFIKDMENIYNKNAYKPDDVQSSAAISEIYSSMRRLRKEENEELKSFAELSSEEKTEFSRKVSDYVKIVDEVLKERDKNE